MFLFDTEIQERVFVQTKYHCVAKGVEEVNIQEAIPQQQLLVFFDGFSDNKIVHSNRLRASA